MDRSRSHPPLYQFFTGLTEYVFQTRLGVADPPLLEYISALLARFVHTDSIYKIRNLGGRRLEEVAQMLIEAEARMGDARREVHRHIGDFTLFWTGVYPERSPSASGRDARTTCSITVSKASGPTTSPAQSAATRTATRAKCSSA